MGISLTEQGYKELDHDMAEMLKHISRKEGEKMKDKQTTQTGFNSRGRR